MTDILMLADVVVTVIMFLMLIKARRERDAAQKALLQLVFETDARIRESQRRKCSTCQRELVCVIVPEHGHCGTNDCLRCERCDRAEIERRCSDAGPGQCPICGLDRVRLLEPPYGLHCVRCDHEAARSAPGSRP